MTSTLMKLPLKEGAELEFKVVAKAIECEDLVAFANSRQGGKIVVGIADKRETEFITKEDVVGCTTSDKEMNTITGKARSCIPPVVVKVSVQIIEEKRCFVVSIPSSPQKPHCTATGLYKIRRNTSNDPLTPGLLLALYLELEAENFISRFKDATKELEEQVESVSSTLKDQMGDLSLFLADFNKEIQQSLSEIGEYASDAQDRVEGVEETLGMMQSENETNEDQLRFALDDINEKLNAILLQQQPKALPTFLVKRDYKAQINSLLLTAGPLKRDRAKQFKKMAALFTKSRPYLTMPFLRECFDELELEQAKRKKTEKTSVTK